jgi:hypothetical protein
MARTDRGLDERFGCNASLLRALWKPLPLTADIGLLMTVWRAGADWHCMQAQIEEISRV